MVIFLELKTWGSLRKYVISCQESAGLIFLFSTWNNPAKRKKKMSATIRRLSSNCNSSFNWGLPKPMRSNWSDHNLLFHHLGEPYLKALCQFSEQLHWHGRFREYKHFLYSLGNTPRPTLSKVSIRMQTDVSGFCKLCRSIFYFCFSEWWLKWRHMKNHTPCPHFTHPASLLSPTFYNLLLQALWELQHILSYPTPWSFSLKRKQPTLRPWQA